MQGVPTEKLAAWHETDGKRIDRHTPSLPSRIRYSTATATRAGAASSSLSSSTTYSAIKSPTDERTQPRTSPSGARVLTPRPATVHGHGHGELETWTLFRFDQHPACQILTGRERPPHTLAPHRGQSIQRTATQGQKAKRLRVL